MTILTVGIDLAKSVFAVHWVNAGGKPELVKPSVRRDKLGELVAALPPPVIGLEACSGAHHWAVAVVRPHGAADCTEVCYALPHDRQAWQELCGRRRCDLRSVVAVAAKNARMAWAVLRKGEAFALPAWAQGQGRPHTTGQDNRELFDRRVTANVDGKRVGPPRAMTGYLQGSASCRPTNGSPACGSHQGPRHDNSRINARL
jgi:hypothetical protein